MSYQGVPCNLTPFIAYESSTFLAKKRNDGKKHHPKNLAIAAKNTQEEENSKKKGNKNADYFVKNGINTDLCPSGHLVIFF